MGQFQFMVICKPLPQILLISLFLIGCGSDVSPGKIEATPRTSESIYQQDLKFLATKNNLFEEMSDTSQILFGDLHVHTTYSIDAFTLELPMMGLQGIHDSAMAVSYTHLTLPTKRIV